MTPLTLSSPTEATPFRIILWRCLAGSEHGITQPRPHDLRWVVRRVAGPNPLPHKPNTVVIRRAGYGAFGRLDRVRGVRFSRLTCRAADGPAQPEMTQSRRTWRNRSRSHGSLRRVNSFRQRKSANIPEVPHTALFGSEVAPLGLRYVIGNQNSCGELTWTRLTGRFPSRLCCRSAGAGLSHVLMRAAPGGGRYPCQRDRKKGSGVVHDVAIT